MKKYQNILYREKLLLRFSRYYPTGKSQIIIILFIFVIMQINTINIFIID